MDWTALAVSIVSGVLGIGAVAAFMTKFMPNVSKWIVIAKDAVETLSDLATDLSKGTLTADQMTQLKADVAQFQADLKTALGK